MLGCLRDWSALLMELTVIGPLSGLRGCYRRPEGAGTNTQSSTPKLDLVVFMHAQARHSSLARYAEHAHEAPAAESGGRLSNPALPALSWPLSFHCRCAPQGRGGRAPAGRGNLCAADRTGPRGGAPGGQRAASLCPAPVPAAREEICTGRLRSALKLCPCTCSVGQLAATYLALSIDGLAPSGTACVRSARTSCCISRAGNLVNPAAASMLPAYGILSSACICSASGEGAPHAAHWPHTDVVCMWC